MDADNHANDLEQSSQIPQMKDLPIILEKSNRLHLIDRYLSSIEEFSSFLVLVQQTLHKEQSHEESQEHAFGSRLYTVTWLGQRRSLEAAMTQSKIQRQQKLCINLSLQLEALTQMVI